jgi:hypothetical protein
VHLLFTHLRRLTGFGERLRDRDGQGLPRPAFSSAIMVFQELGRFFRSICGFLDPT